MLKITRRAFLGYTAAAANFGTKSFDRLIPYVVPPEHIQPGEWSIYASGCRECPAGCGMLLRHRDGRVTKAEGIPEHPVSQGGLCPRGQSALQGLYDPDRLTAPFFRPERAREVPLSWTEGYRRLGAGLKHARRVALLSTLETGALAELMDAFLRSFDSERLLFYEPFNYEPLRSAHGALFGKPVLPRYHLDRCDHIVSFGADFLENWISNVEFAWGFTEMHAYRSGRVGDFTYIGPRLSMTAANADEYLHLPPGEALRLALLMLRAMAERGWTRQDLGRASEQLRGIEPGPLAEHGVTMDQVVRMARSFYEAGASAALAPPTAAGPEAENLALAAALLNLAAGRIGTTVDFTHPHALSQTATGQELDNFLTDLGKEDLLLIIGANPVYSRPDLAERLGEIGTIVHLGTMFDETAVLADYLLPTHSPPESWGDYEPYPAVHNLLQPTMAPLHDTRMAGDILLELTKAAGKQVVHPKTGEAPGGFAEWLQHRWRRLGDRLAPDQSFQSFWRQARQRGGFWQNQAPGGEADVKMQVSDIPFQKPLLPPPKTQTIELWAWPHIMLFDGRVANRAWLQENPEPVSYLVWGSWIDLHPATAARLGITSGEMLELETPAGKVEAPARVTAEVVEGIAAIAFGQGHRHLGRTADGVGANAFALLSPQHKDTLFGRVEIRKTGKHGLLVQAAATRRQHKRNLLQWEAIEKVKKKGAGSGVKLILPLPEGYDPSRDLYPPHKHKKHRWAMVVDLQRCIGCGACAVACYAENNIPVMGRKQLERGRELAWMKVVPYEHEKHPWKIGWLPMFCQHCDAAPCEPVCPVFAAVHTEEGLNAQIYNRCIGTRYCDNNCPYKVRRFNWLNTTWVPPLQWQLNPEVTVRCRGVMEKCTFCVQRIRQVEYQARREDRPIRDGEVQPACVQSCPAKVFTFGDLLDPRAEVTRLTMQDPRRYHVLEKLNTKPAVTYLRRIMK